MQKKRIQAKVKDLVLNEGQLEWLPRNPRQWTRTDIDRTKQSLERDPDFQEDNPLKVVALPDGKLLVFAGNLRTTSAKELKWKTFESIQYFPETEEDHETIKRRAILDNGAFGAWDYDALANEWDDLPLGDWGVPAWNNADGIGDELDLSGLNIDPGAPAGESKSGLSAMTFLFSNEDAELVKAWIDANSKDELVGKIVEICRNAEAK